MRRSLALWWNDCTARALGEGQGGLTVPLLETPGLNQLDHAKILPGDLAVTTNGVHILAYLGDSRWIEADPALERVIVVEVPTQDNLWFDMPMKVVRWKVLSP